MRLLLIAPPGAGKGTQGSRIAAHFGIPHIAIGDLLRSHVARGTDLGHAVQRHLDCGSLVPDEIVLEMVREAFIAAKTAGLGYVLDGYPRTSAQAETLSRMAAELGMAPDVALHLRADDDEVVRRLLARAATEHRQDDTEPVIRRRLALYHQVTSPVLDWYALDGILLPVDGMRTPDEVTTTILDALEVVEAMPSIDLADPVAAATGACVDFVRSTPITAIRFPFAGHGITRPSGDALAEKPFAHRLSPMRTRIRQEQRQRRAAAYGDPPNVVM
ncbi:adenylate kinase [Dactylosporangium darangshiense]|uniref:Adenylate kinase n=1 Tax=Dactylosporangium darangshiense TaxID=579108 RepID=A0ABP8DQI1_9ACTN